MKKQIIIYYASFLIFFSLVSIARNLFDPVYIAFWVGGFIGAILPDVDHLIYVYFLKPHELTSQRAVRMMSHRKLLDTFNLLASTRNERTQLIFHTAMFQLIFALLTFFVVSSSGSLFGRGLVFAFSLHLLVDQYLDFTSVGNMSHWFKGLSFNFDKDKSVIYWTAMALLLVIFAFIF